MTVEPTLWKWLSRVTIGLLLLAGLLAVVVWFYPLINTSEQMRKRVYALDAQIARAEAEQRQLRGTIDALMRDPKAVERVIRESLNYARPGETVFRFTNSPAHR